MADAQASWRSTRLDVQHSVDGDGHVVLCDGRLVRDRDGLLFECVHVGDAVHLAGGKSGGKGKKDAGPASVPAAAAACPSPIPSPHSK
eukprot:227821-Chlamydomonas_euryale.AAC.2